MKRKIVKLFLVLSMLCTLCITSCDNGKKNTDFLYYFEQTENDGINTPITNIPVNGEEKYFIIDTGANMSLIDETYYLKHKNDFQFIKYIDLTVHGVSGGKDVQASYIIGELGDSVKIQHQFMTSDLRGVISNIKSACGHEIIGIIGSDYLIRYDFSVDFKNRAIYRNVMPLDSIIKNDLAMN